MTREEINLSIAFCIPLQAIAEQPNEILKYAMYLFLGYFEMAQSGSPSHAEAVAATARSPEDARMMRMNAASPTAAWRTNKMMYLTLPNGEVEARQ